MPGDDAPEVRKVGRIIVNAPSREAARALLMGVSEDFRCAVIRFLPFEYKAALIDLTPNPDERNDIFWLFGGFCGRDSGIGPAQRAKTTIWN